MHRKSDTSSSASVFNSLNVFRFVTIIGFVVIVVQLLRDHFAINTLNDEIDRLQAMERQALQLRAAVERKTRASRISSSPSSSSETGVDGRRRANLLCRDTILELVAGSYSAYFREAVVAELGLDLTLALYDEHAVVHFLTRFSDKTSGDFVADRNPHAQDPGPVELKAQRGFSTFPRILAYLKRSLSISLGRMHRDVAMERQFRAIGNCPDDFNAFNRAVRHLIQAHARNTMLLVQLAITAIRDEDVRARLTARFETRNTQLSGHDPVWVFMQQIENEMSFDDIDEKFNEFLAQKTASTPETEQAELHFSEQMFQLEYRHRSFGEGYYDRVHRYNMVLRPTAACYSMHRECEALDGCRFICNTEYLQSAQEPTTRSSSRSGSGSGSGSSNNKPFHHRILGFGSNNIYDFELSMAKFFGYSTFAVHNKIYSITSFDCTLKDGFKPPAELKDAPMGWGGASFCVGGHTDLNAANKFVSFSEMKERIIDSEKPGHHDIVVRGQMSENAVAPTTTDMFDEVSILKIDIEVSEFPVIDAWNRGEHKSLRLNPGLVNNLRSELRMKPSDGHHRSSSSTLFTMIDFDDAVKDFFSVSMVLIEVHAWHRQMMDLDFSSMFKMHVMLQQLHQLGFVMISSEKNLFATNDCCFELVYVHHRYFTRSEMWMERTRRVRI